MNISMYVSSCFVSLLNLVPLWKNGTALLLLGNFLKQLLAVPVLI